MQHSEYKRRFINPKFIISTMKILASGDIHGDTSLAKALAEKAEKENVDLVVLCGDLTYAEQSTEGIIGPFKAKGKQVVLIPGNHETFATVEFLTKQYSPDVFNLHGRSMMFYNEIGLFGAGGSNIGLFELTENETHKILENAHKPIANAKHKIMITHSPPFGTKIDALWEHVGSKAVRKQIELIQPNMALCGHIHETFGKTEKIGKTTVVNVGKEGIVVEIKKD